MHRGRPHMSTGPEGSPSDTYTPETVYGENEYSRSRIPGSIFGWSWFGNWADNTLRPDHPIRQFLDGWVAKFEAAANAELTGGWLVPVESVDSLVEQFQQDLWQQDWWKNFDASWQAVQRLRYGTDVPAGEYESLVESTIERIGEVASGLGFVDPNTGSLTLDLTSSDIREFAENVILDASDVFNNLPSLNSDEANRLIEQHLLDQRGVDTIEGDLQVGAGSLQDLYNQLKNLANANYVSIDSEELWDLAVGVKREDASLEWARDRILGKVGDQYSFLNGSSILGRITGLNSSSPGEYSSLRNHLSPLRETLAEVWELGDNEVDLQNVFGSDLRGESSLVIGEGDDERFMNSREMRKWARTQPQFKDTQAYSTGMSSIASSMLQMFGAR